MKDTAYTETLMCHELIMQASIAEDRIRNWGGESDNPQYKENKVATT